MRFLSVAIVAALLTPIAPSFANATTSKTVSQYGITWTFDKPYPVGQFVTGDWWVVGPVTVVSVSPAPGPGPATEPNTDAKSRYGAVSLVDDKRYRNGSMIVLGPDKAGTFDKQGYDSRATNYEPGASVPFPCQLPVNQSLISSISSETYKNGKLATPYIPAALFPDQLKGLAVPEEQLALDTIAVLTCLDKTPPADAFRPPYSGANKTIYETKDIQWNLLPNLKPVEGTPDWAKMARVYQRPWIDHIGEWLIQYTAPGQNQPAYGGVVTYMNSYASLMLMLDGPREEKQKLMIGFLQYGIDLHGLAGCGRQWFSDGGHWMGRKWPILFASYLLNKPELRAFPKVDPQKPILYEKSSLEPVAGMTPTTLFSEDVDTYYGKGAEGQNVLWQVGYHSHPRLPYMEKPYAEWDDDDKFANNYFWVGGNWPGFALSALYLKAKATWNHDAFFDYCDWFMKPGQKKIYSNDGHIGLARYHTDKFVQTMWDTYRAGAPQQPSGTDNLKWVWVDGKMSEDHQHFSARKGRWEPNPKGQ